jgi:hypothetical protein
MIPKTFTQEITLSDGRTITLETGKLAKQADGSVVVRMGDCMLLATAVSARHASPVDFLPLTIGRNLPPLVVSQEDSLREKPALVTKRYLQCDWWIEYFVPYSLKIITLKPKL